MIFILEIYTAQFRYSGEDRFDITVKTGDKTFSPTWEMVMGTKNGNMTEEEYIQKYLGMMELSLSKYPVEWDKLLKKNKVTLICYCKAGDFCHRVLLANFLQDKFPGKVIYKGERYGTKTK